ncbi:uncharacterized protein LOC113215165 isoform X2 [Frankliniella occidentalis]|uniref:Uncharacterized protein LOC113215165 isoform X2 n=1 Tax=Frankliniella occidentalis TaxID=133901 RepID=A0A9C6X2V1_FRAOC|nr:uncharacterized protein LOC113215165 isoform X2 [Frankliniella occidentalis]
MAWTKAPVWYRHNFKDDAGKEVSCRVQDVTLDLHDPLVHYYKTQFLLDETICKSCNWAEDEVSVAEYEALIRKAMAKGGSVVVIEEGGESVGPNIIGAGMYMVTSKNDENVFKYMTGCGMWVRRDRRRRGIGEAIIRGVLAKCQATGVPNFTAFYSGIGSQRAAVKAGLKEIAKVTYAEYLGEDGKPVYPTHEKDCILLGTDFRQSK